MNSTEQAIEQLIKRLGAVAQKNDDQFSYRLVIVSSPKGIKYTFICEETTDKHTFLSNTGTTIESTIINATAGIESACASWGYELP